MQELAMMVDFAGEVLVIFLRRLEDYLRRCQCQISLSSTTPCPTHLGAVGELVRG
jgi:hypothetical protein